MAHITKASLYPLNGQSFNSVTTHIHHLFVQWYHSSIQFNYMHACGCAAHYRSYEQLVSHSQTTFFFCVFPAPTQKKKAVWLRETNEQ